MAKKPTSNELDKVRDAALAQYLAHQYSRQINDGVRPGQIAEEIGINERHYRRLLVKHGIRTQKFERK